MTEKNSKTFSLLDGVFIWRDLAPRYCEISSSGSGPLLWSKRLRDMSSSPRIKRRKSVGRNFTKYNFRKAFPYLVDDFKGRCAYSMQHVDRIGDTAMHIDHFDPRLKEKYKQVYSNLYLASSQCNIAKGKHWPTLVEQSWGL